MPGRRKTRGLLTCDIALLDDSSFQQVYKRSALGQDVFDAVCRTLEVLEVEYFGLQCETNAGLPAWLDLTKPIRNQVSIPRSGTLHLEFRVKFFVRNPNQLQDEYTRYLFALQLRRDIYSKRLPCPHQAAAKLLAVLVQGELGDYEPEEHTGDYISGIELLPHQPPELFKDAQSHHQSSWCQSLTPAACDFMFVDLTRRLTFYGHEKYSLDASATGQPFELSVSHEGVSVILFNERQTLFSWPCVERILYKNRRLLLHLRSTPCAPVLFFFQSSRSCKRFWQFAIEYHTFFRRISPPVRGSNKKRQLFRTGSKYRFSGRTQAQIINEIRERHDVVLNSDRSTSPSFKRYSLSRLSSAKRSLGTERHPTYLPSPTSLNSFHFVPAVTVTASSPLHELSAPESDSEAIKSDAKPEEVAPADDARTAVVTKTEIAPTQQESTVEERQPSQAALAIGANGHVAIRLRTSAGSPDTDRTPMNMSPREGQELERTFSHELREGQLSDLSELVRRFSTPDFSAAISPSPTAAAAAGDDERTETAGVASETPPAVEEKSESDVEHDDDRTPAVSADESCVSPPESAAERHRAENRNETVGGGGKRPQHHRASPAARPASRNSDLSLSDSDDNLSMTEERTIRALKRRMTRHSKKKPTTKSFYISQELRDTERSYIADLDMLNVKFRNAIQTAGALPEEKTNELFQQLDGLQEFHMELMVELENRMILWEGRSAEHDPTLYSHIGDIMAKRMSEMRIYTPYILDQSRLLGLVQQWADENIKFRDLYNNFEADECHLPLLEFFNRPMQRMVHYKLLLDRLIKAYDPSHSDVENLKAALLSVSDAADYTNRQCKLAENEKKLVELQRELSGIENLVKKGRYLVREGRLLKVGRNGPRQRHFLLFNDLLLYVAPRAIGLPQVKSTISLKDSRVEMCEDGNPYGENALALYTPSKSFYLIARSVKERDVWVEDINSSIEDTNGAFESSRTPSVSDLGQITVPSNHSSLQSTEEVVLAAPLLLPFEMYDECQRCRAEFTLTKRRHHCSGCGRVMCATCLKYTAVLPFYGGQKKRRVCRDCYQKYQALHRGDSKVLAETLQGLSKAVAKRTPSKKYGSPTHSYASSDALPEDYASSQPRLSDVTASRSSLSTLTSDEGSLWSSDTASRSSNAILSIPGGLSIPNGLDEYPGESLTELSELPGEGEAEVQPPSEESSPVSQRGARARAQTMDPHLVTLRNKHMSSFRATPTSPFRRNTSLRYDTAKRMRARKRFGVLDDEGMVSSVANHMSGYLLCKLEDYDEQRWKRHWVVCTSYCLFFYRTHHETKPVLTVAVTDYELSVIGPSDGALCELPHSFKLTNDNQVNCFVADSSHALERWMEVITNCRAGPNRRSTYHVISA